MTNSSQPPDATKVQPLKPGDEAAPGTPGAGEDVCPVCGGRGKDDAGQTCGECQGTGKVTSGIGGG